MSSITKSGIILCNNFVEETQYGKQGSIYKEIKPNLQTGIVEIYTNKNGTISSKNTIAAIPKATIEALAGQTLCMSYEVNCSGDRSSTEQGQTAYNYTRYGIHGAVKLDDTQYYPFASYLNYSGTATKVVQTWTIPTGKTTYRELGFSVQNFDKPASTNNEIWFIRNMKIEVGDHATPYLNYYNTGNGDGLSAREIIEI